MRGSFLFAEAGYRSVRFDVREIGTARDAE